MKTYIEFLKDWHGGYLTRAEYESIQRDALESAVKSYSREPEQFKEAKPMNDKEVIKAQLVKTQKEVMLYGAVVRNRNGGRWVTSAVLLHEKSEDAVAHIRTAWPEDTYEFKIFKLTLPA